MEVFSGEVYTRSTAFSSPLASSGRLLEQTVDHLNNGSRCITLWDKVEVVGEQKSCKDCATMNITTPRTTTNNSIMKKKL